AAPFAILDAIYTAIRFNLTVDPTLNYPPLDAFWSVDNTSNTTEFDIDSGELGGSFYIDSLDSLFIVGEDSADTDEFDSHVVIHEWGHYLDDNFLRTESPAGTHALGDKLDPRLAFNEGWPTAFAAMALNDPEYCDTGTPGTFSGFGINTEGGAFGGQGYYDEVSVIRFLYDLWDTTNEGTDTGSIGLQAIYDAFVGPFTDSRALATLFSYAAVLRPTLDADGQALLDAQLGDEQVDASVLNIWGDNETNDGNPPSGLDVLPVYVDIVADGSTTNICSNSQFDFGRDGNKLSENRFLRISVPVTDEYDVTVATTTVTPVTPDPNDRDQSDPDIYIYSGKTLVASGISPAANIETFRTTTLTAGLIYAAAVEDWRFDDDEAPSGYPERICMDVTFAPTP
ncbi:MAG: hypothetical protein KJO82_14225, partial [Gammaproteobacteria bacterium]|nr:hypothetical protein [Gammaproteobacteria bacterium]